MKPYWSGDGISLYLGDCRDVTEWLAADVLVTDPPYGRNWNQGARRDRPRNAGIANDKDTTVRDAALAAWGVERPAVVFGDLMLEPPVNTRQVLIYQKPPDAGAHGARAGFRRDVEAVYLVAEWHGRGMGGRSSVLRTAARIAGSPAGVAGRNGGHPHTKPDDVMQTLIAACPPGTIADPFAGSGSTLVAAKLQGRKAIGVELEERYCEIAARRLDQHVMEFPA